MIGRVLAVPIDPMNAETAARLSRLNRDFYSRFAGEFGQSREHAWPGWTRILDLLRSHAPRPRAPLRILDVGCGNGRWASYLAGRLELRYLGIDESDALLSQAARRLEGRSGFALDRHDVTAASFLASLSNQEFDLVTMFGLLHHIPGRDRRRALVRDLAGHAAQGGSLVLSFWRFGDVDRFKKRILSWSDYNRKATEQIDPEDLEPGDHILSWGSGDGVRYCHFASPEEIEEVSAFSGLERIDDFTSDGSTGDLNRYLVLSRRSGSDCRAGSPDQLPASEDIG